mmetsp:Transcript_9403/g.10968  ORF Transcript_9403/g.10968 Transcript_9403/m.10968 type:complete len:257 (-) Transcript_9403:843-1613(-)
MRRIRHSSLRRPQHAPLLEHNLPHNPNLHLPPHTLHDLLLRSRRRSPHGRHVRRRHTQLPYCGSDQIRSGGGVDFRYYFSGDVFYVGGECRSGGGVSRVDRGGWGEYHGKHRFAVSNLFSRGINRNGRDLHRRGTDHQILPNHFGGRDPHDVFRRVHDLSGVVLLRHLRRNRSRRPTVRFDPRVSAPAETHGCGRVRRSAGEHPQPGERTSRRGGANENPTGGTQALRCVRTQGPVRGVGQRRRGQFLQDGEGGAE